MIQSRGCIKEEVMLPFLNTLHQSESLKGIIIICMQGNDLNFHQPAALCVVALMASL